MQEEVIECNGEKFYKTTYNGISVIRDSNGYYQASKICKDNNKRFKNWIILERTNELLGFYENEFKNEPKFKGQDSAPRLDLKLLFKRHENFEISIRGWYIHPELVHHICEWCDLKYAIKVARIMNMINEELKQRNIELEDKINEMTKRLEKLELEIQNKSVKTKVDTRNLRIYDITNYEVRQPPFDLMDEDCLWWVSANHLRTDEYRVLLEVQVVSSMHARMDMKEFFNRNKVNGKLNTVKPSCKEMLYNFIMKTIKPKNIHVNLIGPALIEFYDEFVNQFEMSRSL